MSAPMSGPVVTTFQAVGGFWAAVSIDAVSDGQVFAHVAVSVGSVDQLTGEDLSLSLTAQGMTLPVQTRPSGALIHLETRAITAVGLFSFGNSDRLALSGIALTVRNETVSWNLSDDEPPPLPIV